MPLKVHCPTVRIQKSRILAVTVCRTASLKMDQLLSEWGLEHILPSFRAAGISLSDFPTLKLDDLKYVLTNVHDFVYFFEKLEGWRKINSEPQINQTVVKWSAGSFPSFDFGNSSLTNSIIDPGNLDTLPDLSESICRGLDSAIVIHENVVMNSEMPNPAVSEPLQDTARKSPILLELKTAKVRDKQVPSASGTVSTYEATDIEADLAQSTPNSRALKKLDLQGFSKKDSDGKAMLTVYHKTGYLTPRLRNLLVQKIIKIKQDEAFENISIGEVLPEFRITTEEFKNWAKEIHEVFPSESVATYYIPYAKVQGQRICASGKLWEHFHYTKTVLHERGLLRNKRKNKENAPETDAEEPCDITDEDNEKLSWLRTHIEPWGRVVEYWDKTSLIRRHNLITENTSVADYLKTYRCLQQELGSDLIHRDFEKLYPGKGESLLNRWAAIRTRLSELLQGSRKPKGLDNEVLVDKLQTLSPERQDALILYLLPTLVKPTQLKYQPTKKRKIGDPGSSGNGVAKERNKRPLILESQEAFVLHVYNAASVEPAIANKKAQLLQQGLTAQPHIVLVGPLDNIQASYVVVDDVRYTTTSPLKALDLTFKTFYATDCEYPHQAFHIWLFIQKVAYDITNPGDKFGTNINTLIGEVLTPNQPL